MATFIKFSQVVMRQYEVQRREVVGELVRPFGAGNHAGNGRLRQKPCERNLRSTCVVAVRDGFRYVDNVEGRHPSTI